jgi:hypothetical protein
MRGLIQKIHQFISGVLLFLSIVALFFYILKELIIPGYKGISETDLAYICIFMSSFYLLKTLLLLGIKNRQDKN